MKHILLLAIGLIFIACQPAVVKNDQADPARHIILLYTNDEHGWMEPEATYAGAAGMLALWKKEAGEDSLEHLLILSGGDMWTGPAISTITHGKSMVEIMNRMKYDAVTLGNHEFDFTVDTLRQRIMEMQFPVVAANIREKASGNRPDFVLPYTLQKVNGVSVGIIGLSSKFTPTTTKPDNVALYNFTDYITEIKLVVPQLKAAGAELIVICGHLCYEEMRDLAPQAKALGISVIGGGHCHETLNETVDGVTLVQTGSNLKKYAVVDLWFDNIADTVISIHSRMQSNTTAEADSSLQKAIASQRQSMDIGLTEVIGYAREKIPGNSVEMRNLITDSWLYMYPQGQIAITNTGGIRQEIQAGNITIETIFGLLPFQNSILELKLTGAQFKDCLTRDMVIGGVNMINGELLNSGGTLHADSTYRVLINDYMYSLPNRKFKTFDPKPYDTGILYRQPLLDWLRSVKTDTGNPLNNYLDQQPRR
ncbi:MAG: bifunctional metallophosphatase/5'-nucleotidase [Calditrichales bacterium]|nr:MAG: bifunctional metallophosphatase/5'-nucleotidase [Calditrichales bacterium]